MSIALSICIATRNRHAYLREAIGTLSGQLSDRVELVIVDGSSDDRTSKMLAEVDIRTPLSYLHLEVNGGIDLDFDRALERSSGEYCWLCADDDWFRPNAVSRVLDELESRPTVLIVDAEVLDTSMTQVLVHSRLAHTPKALIAGYNRDSLLETCGDHLSFIGATVVQRSFWMSRQRTPYYGSYFIHVGVLFQADFPGFVSIMPGPVVSIRSGNESWTSRTFEIWNVLWPRMIWSILGVSSNAKQKVVAQQPWKSAIRLAKFRALGAYSIAEYRSFIEPAPDVGAFKLIAWLIAICPGEILNTVSLVIASLFMRDNPKAKQDVTNSRFNLWRKRGK
jgi:abequosyltransferase